MKRVSDEIDRLYSDFPLKGYPSVPNPLRVHLLKKRVEYAREVRKYGPRFAGTVATMARALLGERDVAIAIKGWLSESIARAGLGTSDLTEKAIRLACAVAGIIYARGGVSKRQAVFTSG